MTYLTRPRFGLWLRAVVLTAVIALGATACSDGGSDSNGSPAELADAALSAGLKAHAAGDLDAATADYNKVLKYDPTNKYAFYNLALIDSANGNDGLAEAKYRLALESDPNYEPALFNLAILRTNADDPDEAMELYKRAVDVEPGDASAWLNLGLLQRANGQKKLGNKSVIKAIALDPSLKDPGKSE